MKKVIYKIVDIDNLSMLTRFQTKRNGIHILRVIRSILYNTTCMYCFSIYHLLFSSGSILLAERDVFRYMVDFQVIKIHTHTETC